MSRCGHIEMYTTCDVTDWILVIATAGRQMIANMLAPWWIQPLKFTVFIPDSAVHLYWRIWNEHRKFKPLGECWRPVVGHFHIHFTFGMTGIISNRNWKQSADSKFYVPFIPLGSISCQYCCAVSLHLRPEWAVNWENNSMGGWGWGGELKGHILHVGHHRSCSSFSWFITWTLVWCVFYLHI